MKLEHVYHTFTSTARICFVDIFPPCDDRRGDVLRERVDGVHRKLVGVG